jgi:hypothetical protein
LPPPTSTAPSPPPPSKHPHPAPPPKPAPPIQLTALINPVGSLLPGGTGFVEFTVTDTGRGVTKQVTAAITLPAGVTYQDPPMAGGWTCTTAPPGASCQHGPLEPGAVATGYLPVTVAAGTAAGPGPAITVSGGGPSVRERGSVGVASGGLGARFAATGQDTVVAAGATTCPWSGGTAAGGYATGGPASATLALPGQVLWAGLYWSWPDWSWGDRSWPGSSRQAANETIELRGPGGDYQPVTAADVGTAAFPDGSLQSEAFANVTDLVAQYGAGTWAAGVQGYGSPRWGGWQPGRYRQAAADDGWALVVVTTDSQAAPGTQVMVLDGVQAIGPSLTVPLDALPPGPDALISTVTWPRDGLNITSFTQNLAVSPAVTFSTGDAPYLVGVVAVTDAPGS